MGRGAMQDYAQAHMWMTLAVEKNHAVARANRDLIAGKMTAAEISEARRLVREWLDATRE